MPCEENGDIKWLFLNSIISLTSSLAIINPAVDGTNDIVIFEKGVEDLTYFAGNLYFYINPTVGYCYLYIIDNPASLTGVTTPTQSIKCKGISAGDNLVMFSEGDLVKFNPQTKSTTTLLEDVDINYMFVKGNKVLYYNNTNKDATEGLYLYDMASSTNKDVLLCHSTYYCSAMEMIDDTYYFVNYQGVGGLFGDSHFYSVKAGQTPLKLA